MNQRERKRHIEVDQTMRGRWEGGGGIIGQDGSKVDVQVILFFLYYLFSTNICCKVIAVYHFCLIPLDFVIASLSANLPKIDVLHIENKLAPN